MAYLDFLMPDVSDSSNPQVPDSCSQSEQDRMPVSSELRNQFGRTWEEEERHLRLDLGSWMSLGQLEEEIEKQRRAFAHYARLVASPDGREQALIRALEATPPARHARILEAARKSWS